MPILCVKVTNAEIGDSDPPPEVESEPQQRRDTVFVNGKA